MSMKLVILGLLMENDSHPYEIKQKIKDRNWDHYYKMQLGSLYYAIDQLKKESLVEDIQVVSESNRPEKTIYRITDTGRELFQTMLMEQFKEKPGSFHPLFSGLIFMHHGKQEELLRIFKTKIEEQQQTVAMLKELYEEHVPIVPRGVLHLMYSSYEMAEVQLNSYKRILKDIEAGCIAERGKPLDL